ncbi:MAG: GxxExxY protein [Desulforhabdus sp.]|jgi:GxxExxY protein|nr:GxxExxY protein [Desulforhabdus sp.]
MSDEGALKIIGAAMDVHRELSCGFLHAVYQKALGRDLMQQGIPFKAKPNFAIVYKGRPLISPIQTVRLAIGVNL